jgi:uncharacterized protein YjbI with pentapeptide repeats
MANPEHLAILEQGVEVWNKWREENPDIEPDLRGADLKYGKFEGVNLKYVRLGGAQFFHAWVDNADFSGSSLTLTDFTVADLSNSDFRKAGLNNTQFLLSELRDAYFTEAEFNMTLIIDSDLSGARGLESCTHIGRSYIDHRTLARSGNLPIEFLRGCGLPDFIIGNIDVLRGDAIQFYSCFISYSSKDEDFAKRLYADLQNNGVRCWFAPEEMKGGQKLFHQINKAIRLHDKLLLILSEHSMNSTWVETEIRRARRRERQEDRKLLFPIRLTSYETLQTWELFDADEGRDLAAEVREYFIPDFSNWKNHDDYQAAFSSLLRDLKNSA